jgi:transcriptional regulator with XRE-family HTH domain
MLSIQKIVGENIKRLRERKMWTQQELSDLTGISQATISHVEKGHRWPSIETVEILADWFDVDPSELFQANKNIELDVTQALLSLKALKSAMRNSKKGA